jgi:hypothetical protein
MLFVSWLKVSDCLAADKVTYDHMTQFQLELSSSSGQIQFHLELKKIVSAPTGLA